MTSIAEAPKVAAIPKTKIFLVDDHPIFRHGLCRFIEGEPDLEVCGEAASTALALDGLRRIKADLVVVDISLPGANGLELIKHLRAEHPEISIMAVSAHDEQVYALRALRAGAVGYVMKTEAEATFMEAVRKVLSGGVYVSPAFGDQLIYKVARSEGDPARSPLEALTDRELEVLQLVGEGKSSRQIAEDLHLSVKTIESHRLHIKEKLHLETSNDLVRFALDFVAQQT